MAEAGARRPRPGTRRLAGGSVAVLLGIALTGCAGGDGDLAPGTVAVIEPDPQPIFSELAGVPMGTEQQAALADGVVTEEEYLAGFELYRACLRDGGFDLENVRERAGLMIFDLPNEAVEAGVDGECYWREWQELDASWQIGHPEKTEEFEAYNYCLQLAGHRTGTTMDEVEQLFTEAGLEHRACFDRWQQDGMAWYG